MIATLTPFLNDDRERIYPLMHGLLALDHPIVLRSEVLDRFGEYCRRNDCADLAASPLADWFERTQEIAMEGRTIRWAVRPGIGQWLFLRLHVETLALDEIGVADYLAAKERLVLGGMERPFPVEIDMAPFDGRHPKLRESHSIGQGGTFVGRRIASMLFHDLESGGERLLAFLKEHQVRGMPLLLSPTVADGAALRRGLRQALAWLAHRSPDEGWEAVAATLRGFGFEPGWGDKVGRIREGMGLLLDLLEAPEPAALERFLARIPMIFSLTLITPHGFFGQEGVLGMPDTGGQVVYILDQVRALEEAMRRDLAEQGLEVEPQILVVTRLIPEARGTSCDRRLEPVAGTQGTRILRVPFRDAAGSVLPQWVSRFEIWPFLERFAVDAEREILAELGGRPDLIVGNYSDGNLVATLLSRRLGVTQCGIAHALEKAKYLLSDLYWRDNQQRYRFATQYTADLIGMNSADFIVASTFQEIAGTEATIGQYESYTAFTLPDLYRVVQGIDIFDPKFNIVPPGADPQVFFPFDARERRLTGLHGELNALIFGGDHPQIRGRLEDPAKPILFTMARLDRIKNTAGLVEGFGASDRLRGEVNLVIVAGRVDPGQSDDAEEREEIAKMHALFERYGLDGQVRWIGMTLDKSLTGELYRLVADRRGAFVQPAWFEAFGLTVIEAMASGLPLFDTCYGGPLEIIEDGVSGFHIDPNHMDRGAQAMAAFFERCRNDPVHWERLSQGAVARVAARYTWSLHAKRLLTLARVYGFWRFMERRERQGLKRYLEMFYGLQYRGLSEG